jgi:cell division protein FtsW
VFAVLAEELGLAGILFLLVLIVTLVWRSLRIAQRAAEAGLPYHAYCAAAFGIWLGMQSFINIGVNVGLLPTKGLTLPLMSYGGSSILVTLGWLGIVLRINHEASTAGRLAVSRRERSE